MIRFIKKSFNHTQKRAKDSKHDAVIALAGNPNVGKSTIFNELTGMHQHTGNWTGKTVANAHGIVKANKKTYMFVDIPGTYSLISHSPEEEVAGEFLRSGAADAVVIVCDATTLERNIPLILQILEITDKVIVCLNLIDEAKKKRIKINISLLSEKLGVPVVETAARKRMGISRIMDEIEIILSKESDSPQKLNANSPTEYFKAAEEIFNQVVSITDTPYTPYERFIDKLLTKRLTGFPVMLLLLGIIFWITIEGANYPSQKLSEFLFSFEYPIFDILSSMKLPPLFCEAVAYGIWRVLAWVVSVMLPPMAIFFPLFTLLEDLGYLPRVAFNLDRIFKKCNTCGKQSLTMCMGFGCNAAGVTGCRIIDSPRERLIAILTNSFVPCNGRFPAIISIITMFFIGTSGRITTSFLSALFLMIVISFGILMTFAASKLLSATILRGIPSSFTLELPPYRRPQIFKTLIRSLFDRTLFVLGRAVAVAAPAGLVIWLFANITINGNTLLSIFSSALDPFASVMGLDGTILMAFILGFPANEIVIPLIIMAYSAGGTLNEASNLTSLSLLLHENGWTWLTALNFILFSLMHWPCSTTLLTIKKETRSIGWTSLSFLLPTLFGIIICMLTTFLSRIFF